jgi:hypothetical protein
VEVKYMSRKGIKTIFNSIFFFVSFVLLNIYINSIVSNLNDNRLNIRILGELIKKLKMQLWILVLGGAIYISIIVLFELFLNKAYSSDKHKNI